MRRPDLTSRSGVLLAALLLLVGGAPSMQTTGAAGTAAVPQATSPAPQPQPSIRAERPPRDPRVPHEKGTARVSGRVVNRESGAPVRFAQVILSGFGPPRTAESDDEGRYSFAELPAGRYRVHARKDGFVEPFFPGRSRDRSARSVTLAAGQSVDGVEIAISRGGVITGVVTDDAGEPLVHAQVRAAPRRTRAGGGFGMPAQTDDQGRYRVHSLPDGEYLVVVEPQRRHFGPEHTSSVTTGFVRTYHPGTLDRGSAEAVTVEAGRETVANFTLVPRRLVSVSGVVRSASGRDVGDVAFSLRRQGDVDQDESWMGSGAPYGRGQFNLHGVAPGEYVIAARVGGGFGPRRADDKLPPEMGEVPIDVGDEPLAGVSITTYPGATISGRIVWDGDRTRQPTEPETSMRMGTRMDVGGRSGSTPMAPRVVASPLKRDKAFGRPPDAEVDKDDRFSLSGVFGDAHLTVFNLPPGWQLKAVEMPAGDVTGSGLKTKPGESISDVRIVVTNKLARLGGRVTDDRGQPADEAMVVLLEPDSKESLQELVRPPSWAAVHDGRYRLMTGRAGSYLVVAVEKMLFGIGTDPDLVAKLRSAATEVTLVEDQQQQLDLTLVRLPDN